jgi:hypothetical protein
MVDTAGKAPTIAHVRAIIARGNPTAKGLIVRWVMPPRKVTFPTGYVGWVGRVSVDAAGYRPRTMGVDAGTDGIRVA